MTSLGSTLTLSGLVLTATGDAVATAGAAEDGEDQALLWTGIATFASGVLLLGAGIPLLVVGKKRKREITLEATEKIRASTRPMATRGRGGGLELLLEF